jgi:site-specific DNA-methyltransferase (adenine-specific)
VTLASGERWKVVNGDALEVLRSLPDASVDAIVTDPPYIIGATSVGNARAKTGTWADVENAATWFADWLGECRRALRASGHMFVFTSWRSLPTLQRAASMRSFAWAGCLVWNKATIGPGGSQSFRPSYELVLHAPMPDAALADRGIADVQRFNFAPASRTTEHPAEKPVHLMRWLCRIAAPRDGLVVDPFTGSGTTGEACALERRRFLGVEREGRWCDVARRRIVSAIDRPPPLREQRKAAKSRGAKA